MEREFDLPEMYPQYLEEYREKFRDLMSDTTLSGAHSKLERMKRYHRPVGTPKIARSDTEPLARPRPTFSVAA